jgi:taurine dioxygenase
MTTGALSDAAQAAYNEKAIDLAARMTSARGAARAAGIYPKTEDERFPRHNRVPLGVAREYARMGNQPLSDATQALGAEFGAHFEHLGLTIGTVIHGVTLRDHDDEAFYAFLRQVLLERKVIFFRDQHLSEDEQVAFAKRFGNLDAFPFSNPGENPYIAQIIHDQDFPGTENSWHTDVTWMERPSLGSVAQCVQLPPYGGDTLFSDSHAAYLGLPQEIAEKLEGVVGTNDYRLFLARGEQAFGEALVAELKEKIPYGVLHPLLRTHPETGKTALFFNSAFLRHDSLADAVTGEPLGDEVSRALVAQLLQQHHRPEYICRFPWTEGALAFWDNRAVQHYAASDYYPHRRVLRRVTISGSRPYYAPEEAPAVPPLF